MTIYQFKNMEHLYDSIGKGAIFQDWIYVGMDWQLHYTSTKPALFHNGEMVAHSLKSINREMKFYGLSFVLD